MTDPGPAFVSAVREALMVDDAFACDEERGFSWWAHRLRQTVTAGEPERGACRVRVETDVLACRREEPAVDAALVELMRFPPLAAFVFSPAAGCIRLFSAVTVPPGEPPAHLAPLAAVAAALQATYAELGVASLRERTGLAAASSDHPRSGARPHPDGMLNLAAARIAPAGKDASRWAHPGDLLEAADALGMAGFSPKVDPRGVSVRFPFRPNVPDPLAPKHSALLQVRVDAPHPELGYGVFLRLFLPGGGVAPTPLTAMRLNALEHGGGADAPDALGSWTLESSEPEVTGFAVAPAPPRLAYVLFLANFVKVPGLLRDRALDMAQRTARAAALLGG